MLLQQIVETLDVELERLETLRSLVSGLSGTLDLSVDTPAPAVAPVIEAEKQAAAAPASSAGTVQVTKGPKPRRPYTKRARKLTPEAKALASNIPAGPVVVTPATLAKQHAARQEQRAAAQAHEPAGEVGSLGSMIRALRLNASA